MQVKDKFELDGVVDEEKFDQVLTLAFQNALRNWKSNLHRRYQKYDTNEDRLDDPPPNITHTRRRNADGQSVWADSQSKQIYVHLKELREQQELESDACMTSDEILMAVYFGLTQSLSRGLHIASPTLLIGTLNDLL